MNYDGYNKYDARVASTYDSDRRHEEHWLAENAFVEHYASSHRLGRVLDMPVGTGRLLSALSSAEHIVGLDVSPDMLAMAVHAAGPSGRTTIELVRGDALQTNFESNSFDTVVCFRLLHLLPPEVAPRLFIELSRICRAQVLLQVYVHQKGSERVWAPVIKRFVSWSRPWRRKVTPTTPWSHIASFPHTQEFIDSCIASAGLRLVARHPLGGYFGSSVEVLELAK